MNRSFAVSIATLALSFLASACGDADETSQGQQSATSGSSSSAASSSGASSSTGGPPPDGFGFQPSNLPSDFPIDDREDVVIDGQQCGLVTDPESTLELVCATGQYTATVLKQSDGSELMVFSMKSLTLTEGSYAYFEGPLPAVFVVAGKVTIAGTLVTAPSTFMDFGAAGGKDGLMGFMDGQGPGAGGKADEALLIGGGGASFCGGGAGTNGGAAYGTAELIPLLGGSSGGAGYGRAGAGGGAIQIVAKDSIEVTSTGVINVGGGGGTFGSGAGSGGALLFEAPSISIAGVLAANGGGGAGNGLEQLAGERGQPSGVAALGGKDLNPANQGGDGSDHSKMDGSAGTYAMDPGPAIPNHAGGSGGGAGRIRLNTFDGVTIMGTVSPEMGSTCGTEGTLQAL